MRARSVEKKRKKVGGSSLCLLIPHPNPLPTGEGVWKTEGRLALEHETRMAFLVPLFPDGDNLIDGDVANLILVVL
jgi:hypothetical protein